MQSEFKAGERVKHTVKTDWGLGEVLSDSTGGRVNVFFEDVGPKEFDMNSAKFTKVTGDESESDYLSALVRNHKAAQNTQSPSDKKKQVFIPFSMAVQNFLSRFPEGFLDSNYIGGKNGEREYKLVAHQTFLKLLNRDDFYSLLGQGKFKEVCDRAKSVVNKTNLIHQYEKIWLANGLEADANQKRFAESLFDVLFGDDEMSIRFERFSNMLYEIKAAKWPIATYFLFIMYPESHIFLKPQVTQNAADILGMPINYRPELNWLTYKQVLTLAELIRTKLLKDARDFLSPRDMIDVQSFMWVIAPGYDG